MAYITRPSYTKPIPPGATIFTRKGERFARWQDKKGKTRTAPLTENGQRIRMYSRCLRIIYRDAGVVVRRDPDYGDKAATLQKKARLEKRAAQEIEGLVDPFEEQRKRPLAEHIADYWLELEARDNKPSYVGLVISRLTALFEGCGFRWLTDIAAAPVNNWLADLRRKGRTRVPLEEGKQEFTTQQAAAILGIKPAPCRFA
jgi:hypothetical protein